MKWTASSEFGTYRLCEQRRFRRACASAQSRQNLLYSLIEAMSQEEPSDRKPDPRPLWMAGHAQLKFVMTECSKTQIRLTGLKWNYRGDIEAGLTVDKTISVVITSALANKTSFENRILSLFCIRSQKLPIALLNALCHKTSWIVNVVCLFVLGFYGPVNNEVMSSRSVNSGTVPGQA